MTKETDMEPIESHIRDLLRKAALADKSEDAMRFSQAATNASNALVTLFNIAQASGLK